MNGYKLHPEAYTDLAEIWEYIAADNLDAADRVLQEIYEAVQSLVTFPHLGHRRPDLTNRPLRFIRCYDYLIAYASEEHPLWVVAVIHGSRSPRLLAALLRERQL